MPDVPRILPGQLWRWSLSVNDGWWPWQRVTGAGRVEPDSSVEIVRSGDLFAVMVVDDPGPYRLHEFNFDANGVLLPAVAHRWHVVLLRDVLCWFDHAWFGSSELACDVP